MPARLRPRIVLLVACVAGVVIPVPAGAEEAAPSRAELQAQANTAAARWSEARAARDDVSQQINRLELELAELDGRVAELRRSVMAGVVGLYQQGGSSGVDVGDPSEALDSARRNQLVGQVGDMARAAVADLNRAATQRRQEQGALEERRTAQEGAVAQLNGERRVVEGRLASLLRAERAMVAGQAAAARAAAPQPAPTSPPVPGAFVCPIAGPVAFSDDFGGRRGHRGNDLMNPRGTPNVAVVAGEAYTRHWSGGGLTLFLTGDDGNDYVYAHLSGFNGPLPRRVAPGEVIGFTGMTGNATAYHTHFQYHPGRGGAVNPYPLVAAACLHR